MPLVAAKCTECGGSVQVDSEKKAMICENCGNAFIVQEAINHFNTNYFNTTNKTTNISNSIVNIHEQQDKDFVIEAGMLKKYCGESTSVTVPDNVIGIGERAFSGLVFLQTIELPNQLKTIGYRAFSGCIGLTSISIPESVEIIEKEAFKGCIGLIDIFLPEGVKSLGAHAFYNCTKLSSVTLPTSLQSIKGEAFLGCKNLLTITIPNNKKVYRALLSHALDDCPAKKVLQDKKYRDIESPDTDIEQRRNDYEAYQSGRNCCKYCGGELNIFREKCTSCGKAQ